MLKISLIALSLTLFQANNAAAERHGWWVEEQAKALHSEYPEHSIRQGIKEIGGFFKGKEVNNLSAVIKGAAYVQDPVFNSQLMRDYLQMLNDEVFAFDSELYPKESEQFIRDLTTSGVHKLAIGTFTTRTIKAHAATDVDGNPTIIPASKYVTFQGGTVFRDMLAYDAHANWRNPITNDFKLIQKSFTNGAFNQKNIDDSKISQQLLQFNFFDRTLGQLNFYRDYYVGKQVTTPTGTYDYTIRHYAPFVGSEKLQNILNPDAVD